ncbi:SMP-30/gluconolactonase/LRE family protein [Epibacterium sp. SM1979]|uniref:SMP-30/gluconolactonase/LRE family protein n=1 Tax=Tritonibacter litoralis TaxID=2662264 RepID=A0A843YJI5_9RHOB|nr:SMP-30/gluconolactonase/LRE family protein [Tritonibacter litoralis]MQQ09594.1 SMP-30/gluconolactonase/LRE family protein [Tritonibacter litoralis]
MSPTPAVEIFDDRGCTLGEGPLWHPERQQLFWFDIVNNRLLSRGGDQALTWQFDRNVSAAGWIDHDHLLIASETGLSRFNLETQAEEMLCEIEADNPLTRSNDGRADPWGGFWMGTMSKAGDMGQGTLYRWRPGPDGGTLRVLETDLSTPNAICFDKQRACAYWADTKTRIIWRQPVDPETGWPQGEKSVFVNLLATAESPEHKPDGAVVDADGCLWSAQWGSARVARYSPEGTFLDAIALPTGHTSCPAFGGPDMSTLFVTTAQQKLPQDRPEWLGTAGQTLIAAGPEHCLTGQPEPQMLL